jgi:LmbE family N-acetylglucosaminyl deacetylase
MDFGIKGRTLLGGKLKVKTAAFSIILVLSSFFPLLSSSHAYQSPVDIVIFSPHPDDETLCCGGTILKAIQDNKRVKVVFLTNGDGYSDACSAWLKKEPDELIPEDYIALGEQRQKEALQATNKLGLKEEDAVFLSYPDSGLFFLWEERYNDNSFYKSPTTKRNLSPYKITFNRAKERYTRQNLLTDIKDILKRYKPKRIYTPYPLDRHKDHRATTHFVNLALRELMIEGKNKWVNSTRVSYYLIHSFSNESISSFSQKPSRSENIVDFKNQKAEVLKVYRSQLSIERERDFFECFLKDDELFWDIPIQKEIYLRQLEEEWGRIAEYMHTNGYNVNFAPVVDVVDNIGNTVHPLGKKQRMYSQCPRIVTELASAIITGMTKGGIIPVAKHFPGLGRSYQDAHLRLPILKVSKEELYRRDLLPFKELIERSPHIWIMVDHAIYPCLSDKPASLSYEIQTKLLRGKLGFKGIILVDELLGMQAIKEYAFKQGIKEPYIGELVVKAFQAGTDIAIIYPSPKKAEEIIFHIIQSVKQAVEEGKLKEKDINESIKRILREKEKIFGIPLESFLKKMSLEEKIFQKLVFDCYKDFKMFKKYNLGGMHLYVHDRRAVEEVQKSVKIPMFIIGQHEGGIVSQYGINTRSAYVMGKEFERIVAKARRNLLAGNVVKNQALSIRQEAGSLSFDQLDKDARDEIFSSLLNFMDTLIECWLEMKQLGRVSPHPNYLSPLTHFGGRFEIKPFKDVPRSWLRGFSNPKIALCAYQLFKDIFNSWAEEQKISRGAEEIIFQLELLKQRIKEIEIPKDTSMIRILCLSTHPDDEDGEALVYFGKKFNCETYILLATRGEGGENEISSCLYKELGFLRTEEIERAASILGVKKVYYLGKNDFGYCLNPEEAFKEWGRQDTLEKLVYFFRLIRPHIIITEHNKFNTRDHGQHQALAILAEDAFDLAGDPQAYPEMIKEGLLPWQPLKFYQRSIRGKETVGDNWVEIDSDEYIFSGGKTIQQLAFEALTQHRSQGNWQWLRLNKPEKIFYQLAKSRVAVREKDSFFKGVSPDTNYYPKRERRILPSGFPGVKIVNNLQIGLIEENNNILFIALKTLGCDFQKIDEEFLKEGDLLKFDTIVIGQGLYNILPSLVEENERLIDFVKKGGNLVVFFQYNRGRDTFSFTPYPLKMSFNPITDENALITILIPEHPLFNFPNKISEQDFKGWLQDRGYSFPFQYSDKYTELLSCPSPTGQLIKGGYLVAHYGKGSYIYTAYAWYRQFREFYFGAYKNLANMLCYPYAEK